MYLFIGKEKCNQSNLLKNLLAEKGTQYHYVDVDVNNMPQNTMTCLKMYCSFQPMVLGVKTIFTYSRVSLKVLKTTLVLLMRP